MLLGAVAEHGEPHGGSNHRVAHIAGETVRRTGVDRRIEGGLEEGACASPDRDDVAWVVDIEPGQHPVGREAGGCVDAVMMRPQRLDPHGGPDGEEEIDLQARRQAREDVDHEDRPETVGDDGNPAGLGEAAKDGPPCGIPVAA